MYAMTDAEETARAFKTAWFTKAARKARIKDDELCEAIEEVRKGQADDLGEVVPVVRTVWRPG